MAIWALSMTTGVTVWTLRALGKHVERRNQRLSGAPERAAVEERLLARLAEIEERVDAATGLEGRILEIEDRQGFAERFLTQQDRDRFPGASA